MGAGNGGSDGGREVNKRFGGLEGYVSASCGGVIEETAYDSIDPHFPPPPSALNSDNYLAVQHPYCCHTRDIRRFAGKGI